MYPVAQGCERFAHIAFSSPDHPEALRAVGKLATKGMRCRKNGDKGTELGQDTESIARIRIQPGRSPEARQRRREAARRKNAAQETSGVQGLQPLGERETRVLRMKIAELAEPLERGGAGGVRYNTPCPPEA